MGACNNSKLQINYSDSKNNKENVQPNNIKNNNPNNINNNNIIIKNNSNFFRKKLIYIFLLFFY